jgi:hypothetical protein
MSLGEQLPARLYVLWRCAPRSSCRTAICRRAGLGLDVRCGAAGNEVSLIAVSTRLTSRFTSQLEGVSVSTALTRRYAQ